jgi:hypothetical protein
MNQPVKAGLFAVAVGVVGLAALSFWFGAFNLVGNEPQWRPAEVPVIELMAPETEEFVQQHIPGEDGLIDRTVVQFRNGDSGLKTYRDDGTLSEYTVEYLGGGTRMHLQYAPNGKQVVAGYELRDDRSMKWKASSKENLIEVTTFYYDGTTIFSVAHQKVNDPVIEVRYYRENHTQWAHQRYRESQPETLEMHALFDERGNPVYRLENQPSKILVSYYRQDGTIEFVQHWNAYSMGPMGGGGWGLQIVDTYDASGKTVARKWKYSTTGAVVMGYVDYLSDGSEIHTEVRGAFDKVSGTVSKVTHKKADGTVLHVNVPRSEMPVENSSALLVQRPTPVAPVLEWSRLESVHHAETLPK